MDANAAASIGLTTFTSSAIVVFLINKLKSAKWFPFLQKEWATANRVFSVVVAFFVSQGVHWVWSADTRVLAITIPTLWAFILGMWHWLNQYAMQETLHQLTKPKVAIVQLPAEPARGA